MLPSLGGLGIPAGVGALAACGTPTDLEFLGTRPHLGFRPDSSRCRCRCRCCCGGLGVGRRGGAGGRFRSGRVGPARCRSDWVVGDEGAAGRRDRPGHDRARARARVRGLHVPVASFPLLYLLSSLALSTLLGLPVLALRLSPEHAVPAGADVVACRPCRSGSASRRSPRMNAGGGFASRFLLPVLRVRPGGARELSGATLPGRGGARHGRAGAARAGSSVAWPGFAPHAGGSCSNRECLLARHCLLVGVIPTRESSTQSRPIGGADSCGRWHGGEIGRLQEGGAPWLAGSSPRNKSVCRIGQRLVVVCLHLPRHLYKFPVPVRTSSIPHTAPDCHHPHDAKPFTFQVPRTPGSVASQPNQTRPRYQAGRGCCRLDAVLEDHDHPLNQVQDCGDRPPVLVVQVSSVRPVDSREFGGLDDGSVPGAFALFLKQLLLRHFNTQLAFAALLPETRGGGAGRAGSGTVGAAASQSSCQAGSPAPAWGGVSDRVRAALALGFRCGREGALHRSPWRHVATRFGARARVRRFPPRLLLLPKSDAFQSATHPV